jgi:flagellar basal-body rod protein FlgB
MQNLSFNKGKNMLTDPILNLISSALDTAWLRQNAIANNMANINTHNYKSLEIQFDEHLQPILKQSDKPPSLDEQLVLNLRNATEFKALITGLNQKLAIMKIALRGNNQV